MKNMLMLSVLCVTVSIAAAQTENSAAAANRRTALRCLQRATQYASEKQWAAAQSQAALGLSYDGQVADLWYVSAVAQSMQGAAIAKVLPLAEKSLTDADWVGYNRDNARIFYADLLADTCRFTEAVAILDAEPFLHSADAEYVRAKAFYNLRGEAYTQRAREKLNAARRVYPMDARFARLFFAHEYARNKAALYGDGALSPLVRKLADSFIAQVPQYPDADAELELYAAIFASGARRTRLLSSFKARGLKAPLYAETALRAGLIGEDEAVERFVEFADVAVDRAVLESFVSLITGKAARAFLSDYFAAYDGSVFSDTDGDLRPNLTVRYSRGRPAFISYDTNQDGEADWTVECDFGVPVLARILEADVSVQYAAWPWVHKVHYLVPTADASFATVLEFNLVSETLSWAPFSIDALPVLSRALDVALFYPSLSDALPNVSLEQLLLSSSSYERASTERMGARIRVSLLDGVPQTARYYTAQGVLYAQAQFDEGTPVVRLVDVNGDGLFETTEQYAETEPTAAVCAAEEMQALAALSATNVARLSADDAAHGRKLYVRMIQIDQNGDTTPDFTEEYDVDGGKISSWDTDGDGLWDTRYVRYARADGEPLREESLFHQPLTGAIVAVYQEDGVPVRVSDGERELAVNAAQGMYWLGTAGSPLAAQSVVEAVSQLESQGISIIVECTDSNATNERMFAVRVGNMIFGELLVPAANDDEEAATEQAE